MAPRYVATVALRSAAAMTPLQGLPPPWLRSSRSRREHGSRCVVAVAPRTAVPDLDENLLELVAATMVGKWV
ncbi:uncharacterized protein J3R85_018100 [Psidium guajava]|nr:uncharacterized protein J3R85_018100 [Psidium guajava]